MSLNLNFVLFSRLCLMLPFVLPLGLGLDLYLPSVPSMTQALAVEAVDIQFTLSIFLYVFGLGQLGIGPITDWLGRRKILLMSASLFAIGSLVCAFSHSISMLLVGRALQALGACGTQVCAFAIVRDLYDGRQAAFLFTSLKGAMAIAPIAAPILGAFLQIYYGWRMSFVVLSLYGTVILVLAFYRLRETYVPPVVKRGLLKSYQTILQHAGFLYFAGCGMITQSAMFGYFSLSPRYFMVRHGLSETQFAFLFSANALVFLITGLIISKMINKIGLLQSTLVGAALLIASGALMTIGHYTFDHPWVLFLPNLLASSSAAMLLGASASGAMLPFKENAGSAAAMFGCFEFIGGGLIGSIAILGNEISVIPLAACLSLLGLAIVFVNVLWGKKLQPLATFG